MWSPGSDHPQMVLALPRCKTMLSPKMGLTKGCVLSTCGGIGDMPGVFWAKALQLSASRILSAATRGRINLKIMTMNPFYSTTAFCDASETCDNRPRDTDILPSTPQGLTCTIKVNRSLTNLLRQLLRPHYLEGSRHRRRSCIRLASANRHRVSAFRNDRFARFAYHAQIAILQLEAHLPRFTWVQVYALEAAQSAQRSTRHTREAEVKLRDFIALALSRICHRHFRSDER